MATHAWRAPGAAESLFACSVSSLSATLSFGLWASFGLTTISASCTRPIVDVRLSRIAFFVSFVLFVVNLWHQSRVNWNWRAFSHSPCHRQAKRQRI